MKIRFIQTGAIEQILIALHAVKWYVDKGFQVFWPIDSRYFNFFKKSAPYVDFISIPFDTNCYNWHLGLPLQIFQEHKISEYFILYSYLGSNGQKFDFGQPENLPHSLKFDEYKYAITQVPFAEKWNLYLELVMDSEAYVLEQISSYIPYTVIHNSPAVNRKDMESHIDESHRVNSFINITNLTPNPFDWISAFVKSQLLAFEDSLHANVVEQLN